jgi:hypothetical protein
MNLCGRLGGGFHSLVTCWYSCLTTLLDWMLMSEWFWYQETAVAGAENGSWANQQPCSPLHQLC